MFVTSGKEKSEPEGSELIGLYGTSGSMVPTLLDFTEQLERKHTHTREG